MGLTLPALWILDLDVEARPDAYLGGDLTTRSLTAIAWSWIGEYEDVFAKGLVAGGHSHHDQMVEMLERFRASYDEADIVTGHNILRYDLPVINGHMTYHGLDPLTPKLASDTLLHGPKSALSYSRSMENMASMYGIESTKLHMSNTAWKRANTLDPSGVESTIDRVTSDVRLHKLLRAKMIERGHLKKARMWSP